MPHMVFMTCLPLPRSILVYRLCALSRCCRHAPNAGMSSEMNAMVLSTHAERQCSLCLFSNPKCSTLLFLPLFLSLFYTESHALSSCVEFDLCETSTKKHTTAKTNACIPRKHTTLNESELVLCHKYILLQLLSESLFLSLAYQATVHSCFLCFFFSLSRLN